MAQSTGPILIAGAITAANELVFARSEFNWRIVPATGLAALALAGLEHIAPGFAAGLAWLCVATVLIVPLGNAPTPLESADKALGFGAKKVA